MSEPANILSIAPLTGHAPTAASLAAAVRVFADRIDAGEIDTDNLVLLGDEGVVQVIGKPMNRAELIGRLAIALQRAIPKEPGA